MKWTASDINKALLTNECTYSGENIEFNSSDIKKNDIFIALPGSKYHGHDFLNNALDNGASMSIVESNAFEKNNINVNSTVKALDNLAIYARDRAKNCIRIAITGSVGKTTCKEMINHALSKKCKVHKSIKSYNNHVGVPYTLANLPVNSEVGIFEVGMNKRNEISPLSKLIKPTISIITSIAPAHIENLGSMEEIAREKFDIVCGMEKNSYLIVNKCGNYKKIIENEIKNLKSKRSDIKIITIDESTINELNSNSDDILNQHINITKCVADILNIDISNLLNDFSKEKGRGNIEKIIFYGKDITLVDDSYNANPTSMKYGINNFIKNFPDSSKNIFIIGEMMELGDYQHEYNKDIIEMINYISPKFAIFTGNSMKKITNKIDLNFPFYVFENSKDLILKGKEILNKHIKENDIIFAKGSNLTGVNEFVNQVLKN